MVEINEFIKQLEAELEDLAPGSLKADTNYHEMDNWNSMYALIVIAFVDINFNVTLNANDMRATKTVRDLYNLVKERTQ